MQINERVLVMETKLTENRGLEVRGACRHLDLGLEKERNVLLGEPFDALKVIVEKLLSGNEESTNRLYDLYANMNQQLSEEIRESDDPNKKRELRAMQMEIINKAEKKDTETKAFLMKVALVVAGLGLFGYAAIKKA